MHFVVFISSKIISSAIISWTVHLVAFILSHSYSRRPYVCFRHLIAVLPNLFSTAAHLCGTAHQTAHYIYGTYFMYKTYIRLFILNDKVTFKQYARHPLIIIYNVMCRKLCREALLSNILNTVSIFED